ncbi:MAG: hypothetical protein V4456_21460 [Bacteroidota bacterium]
MKKLLLPLLLLLFMGCSRKMVLVNMPEDQFKKEHKSAKVVELSERRTVYYESLNGFYSGTDKFYYFKNGRLVLMDEGFHPLGSVSTVPTPER